MYIRGPLCCSVGDRESVLLPRDDDTSSSGSPPLMLIHMYVVNAIFHTCYVSLTCAPRSGLFLVK